ncbi:MAG: T9SS type A sorting domain-containing protein [Bacteroidales bacterium]|nr:T9SS type A sorting domain-containing protein [Bacteroidales bacterium]
MKKLLLVICAMLSLNILTAQKNVLLEEATGTWCSYCPTGIYYIDSLMHTYDNVIAIAIHTNDVMACEDYFEKAKFTSAPSANIGRRFTGKNTDEWFASVQDEMNYAPKASVVVTTQFEEATRLLTAIVTVTALENMEGTYTVGGVVCEDAVSGTTSQYNQANQYSNYYFPVGGFENLPNPVPAYRIAYDHVARQLLSPYEGETGFPMTLAKGQSFAQTFTYYLPEAYDHNYIRVVGIVLNENGTVDNAGISAYANGKTNAAPKFTSVPVFDVPAGTEYIYDVYFHDTDNKDVVVSVEQKPEWLTLKQIDRKSAKLSGVPAQAGEYIVVLKVSDGADATYQEFTITVKDALNASWETLGERAFTQVGYGFIFGTCSYNGDVYTFLYESGFPALYRYDSKNKTWKKLATIMEEMGYDGSIAAGTDGVYVTYNLKSNNLIKVMKYANDEWSEVSNIGKIGSVPKIVVDAQNSVYVAFNDAGESNRYYLNRYKNGNWETMGSYITSGGGSWARLALDSKGVPYVSWVDFYAGNKMYVSKLVGELWLTIGNAPVSEENFIAKNCQDVAIDANGNIYLAYVVKGTEQLAVYRHNGADWEMLGDNVADGTVKGIDVAVDSENNFYVAYADGSFGDKVSVMKYNGTEWSYVGQRAFTESSTDTYMAMTLHNESPCVVYTDIAMGSKASAKYYQLADQFSPVSNLEARVVSDNDIELTWNAPINAEPTKYNIYRNDALIGNTAQTSYVDEDLESGVYNYAVTAVYEDGESEKATATATLTVSVAENNEVVFTMYPNPAKDFVTIESAKDAVVKIYSVNGQMLSQQNISEGINTIDLSNLNAGMYFISVDETMVKIVKK